MPDSSFEDDDDDAFMALVAATQTRAPENQELFRARGEISILRAQLESLQALKAQEVARLHQQLQSAEKSKESQIEGLRFSVDKLQDEKQFLNNELRAVSAKRRRVEGPEPATEAAKVQAAKPPTVVLKTKDEWSQLCNHLWTYTINGSNKLLSRHLARICIDDAVEGAISISPHVPISSALWEYLLKVKDLRLDNLVQTLCEALLALIYELLRRLIGKTRGPILAVPFLLAFVHAIVTFKMSAVSETTACFLSKQACLIASQFVHLLDPEDDEMLDDLPVTPQQHVLERMILLFSFDLIECAALAATQHGLLAVSAFWGDMDIDLLMRILPENTERIKSAAQVNLLYNFTEIVSSSILDDEWVLPQNREVIVRSLLKVFLIDVSIREEFMYFGLNRVLGNNGSFSKVDIMIPEMADDVLHQTTILLAYPIFNQKADTQLFGVQLKHEQHVLSLRLQIAQLLENIVATPNPDAMLMLNQKENVKAIVRVIGVEQTAVMNQPRAMHVYMRLSIISVFVRLLYFLCEATRNINSLAYPETFYEMFVVLMRVAFSSDSLAVDAHRLLTHIRSSGFTSIGVFNKWCEMRSREMAHLTALDCGPEKIQELCNTESDFANGLEFPYDLETVEIAREILGLTLSHDEADNLYYNMNSDTQA